MSKRVIIAIAAAFVLGIVAFVLLLAGALWMFGRGNQSFIENARKSDPRIAKLYELYPAAEARFNDGNRAGRRGAFAPIARTFTLSARLERGHTLSLYRGIGPDGVTIVEGAYGLQSPTGQLIDLTEEEFDALLDANGNLGVLKAEIWKRPRLPTKNL
jgi:hypothetical protein